jgi:hypothetical protein
MITQQPFGRRRTEPPRRQSPVGNNAAPPRAPDPLTGPVSTPIAASAPIPEPSGGDFVPEFGVARPAAREPDQPRKRRRKRWLAEPYRSFSIAASIGFGISSWILPDSIQNVVQLVIGLLTIGGLAAGFRSSYLANRAEDATHAS